MPAAATLSDRLEAPKTDGVSAQASRYPVSSLMTRSPRGTEQRCQDMLTDADRVERLKIDALNNAGCQAAVVADAHNDLESFIARARHWCATWAEIAEVLGVARQSVHQRYRHLRYDPTTGVAWHEPPFPP